MTAVDQVHHARMETEAERIASRRHLRDWRDRWSMEAELRLRRRYAATMPRIASLMAELSPIKMATAPDRFINKVAVPFVADALDSEARSLLNEAEGELAELAGRRLKIEAAVGEYADAEVSPASRPGMFERATAMARGVVMVTDELVGSPSAGEPKPPRWALGASSFTNVLKAANLSSVRSGEERKLCEKIDAEVEARFLSSGAGGNSLLARLHSGFANAAEAAAGESA